MFLQTTACFPETYSERRRAPRRRPARETTCRLTGEYGTDLGTGLVWNISTTGLSMLVPSSLRGETFLSVQLHNHATGESLLRRVTIVHRSAIRTGDHIIGGHFTRALDETELDAFLM